ncbi:hypothetical protein BJ742DRAFT_822045 [Cladochytrium replicatum]|nr:hypothetical protein BJ742DRAFT_822045 [Cladochytrium replicatum]
MQFPPVVSHHPMIRVAIIGGGPAALAAAISISRNCPSAFVRVEIYEARRSLYEHPGVQYTLSYMALNALEVLGVRDKALKYVGNVNTKVYFVDQVRKSSKCVDVTPGPGGPKIVQVPRIPFMQVLADELIPYNVPIYFRKRFQSHDPETGTVRFTDGTITHADLLIGADGISSAVRETILPGIRPIGEPATAGYYMGIDLTDDAAQLGKKKSDALYDEETRRLLDFANGKETFISWGVPASFGLSSLGHNQISFLDGVREDIEEEVFQGKTHESMTPPERRAALHALVSKHSHTVGPDPCEHIALLHSVIDRLKFVPGAWDTWRIRYLPLLPYTAFGTTLIIGDAAHAMPPSLGLGAQASLEDGAYLGLALRDRFFSGPKLSLAETLEEFSDTRRLLIHKVQRLALHAAEGYLRKGNEPLPVLFSPPRTMWESFTMVGSMYLDVWAGKYEFGDLKVPGVDIDFQRPRLSYVPRQIG